MRVSRNLKEGDLVTKHGDKYIRCPRNRKPIGVFHMEKELTMLNDRGLVTFHIPTGIIVKGEVKIRQQNRECKNKGIGEQLEIPFVSRNKANRKEE